MPENLASLVYIGMFAQAAADLVLAFLSWHFMRTHNRGFLRLWAASWACLAVYHLAGVGAITLAGEMPEQIWVRTGVSSLAQVAAFWQILLLLSGVYMCVGGAIPRRRLVGGLIAASGLSLGIVLATMSADPLTRMLARVGTRTGIAGLAFSATAVILIRTFWQGGKLGPRLVASSFLLYGVSLLYSSSNMVASYVGLNLWPLSVYLQFVDLLVQMLAGFGLLLWILEDEHRARIKTSVQLAEREDQLNESQKMQAVGRLAGGVAHDFNNLLTTVLGNVEWILMSGKLSSAHEAGLRDVEQAVRRGSKLTRQLATLSRGAQGKPILEDVGSVIENLTPMLAPMVGRHIELLVDTTTDTCPVRLIEGQTEQVLLNLVANARDAMPDGGTLRIATRRVTTPAGEPIVVLEVGDTGTGMDAVTRSMVFEPYFSTKTSSSGLGLTSVWNIVERAGGRIEIESVKDRGTVVTIRWPLTEPVVSLQPESQFNIPSHRNLSILLVEDDDAVRATAHRTLSEQGHTVIVAGHGLDAIDQLEVPQPFDLVLTDAMMPTMNGFELVDWVRANRPGLPIAMMSGYLGNETGMPEGVKLLPKPFTGAQLTRFTLEIAGGRTERPKEPGSPLGERVAVTQNPSPQ